ncbi:hypothetical protein GC101_25910 [Paenibacillus sp. LMG 31459]|uniref:Uncharacterized protein n=1 Tax=Paenibacillus phytohabitans TaxID=2654978 RepID=A0ABX1YML9_9BACL|nr:hypothetical protein [Paenibacillus phytohabitans]NOU82307.1 hypothetical protein [Paenibacillus phytohabitans]
MTKKYGLVLDSIQLNIFRSLVPEKIRRKTLETFLFNQYKPSLNIDLDGEETEKKRGRGRPRNKNSETSTSTNMALSDEAISVIDRMVIELKNEGVLGANRSSVMRDLILNFNQFYKGNNDLFISPSERKPNTFYLEIGTHDFLNKWTRSRNLNYSIEQYILSPDFSILSITEEEISYLKKVPTELEPIRISISEKAYSAIDDILKNLGSGITRTALMRLVVRRLIQLDQGISLPNLLAKKKLDAAIFNYENIAGTEKAQELISDYLNKNYNKE